MSEVSLKDYPGGDRIRTLPELSLQDKVVFLRVDFNVPLKEGVIRDDTRIRAALPTIDYLINAGAKVLCASHLGRPNGERKMEFSLEPIAQRLGELSTKDVLFSHECVGSAIAKQARHMKAGQILLMENLRFHKGEEENSLDFSHRLAELADVYVNDAFGTCHRAHASTYGLPKLMKQKAAGFLLEREVAALSRLIHNPDRPLISILGGSKVSDKVKVIEALMVKSSKIIIGGAMAYTFLKAINIKTGKSRVELDKVALAKRLLERSNDSNCKIILPMDHVMAENFDNPGAGVVSENTHIPDTMMALDIGPRTRELFKKELFGARSLFWNGPLGVFEKPPFDAGTTYIAQAIADLESCYKVCGGGDSVAAIHAAKLEGAFSHISTGGGASLEMIEGAPMPGIDALKEEVG